MHEPENATKEEQIQLSPKMDVLTKTVFVQKNKKQFLSLHWLPR